ncbi:MAG TPA: hypothetical protein VIB79_30625 [Candidatus Binatia bacterium]
MAPSMKRPVALTVIAVLCILQAVLGFMRANHWFQAGTDLLGQGLLFIPLMGLIAYGRGILVGIIGFIYIAFGLGALAGKSWAWWVGILAAVLNVLLIVLAVSEGQAAGLALIGSIVPVIVLAYLFTAKARQFLKQA